MGVGRPKDFDGDVNRFPIVYQWLARVQANVLSPNLAKNQKFSGLNPSQRCDDASEITND
jgi:hypothetical protein